MAQQLNGARALFGRFESCPMGPESAQDRFEPRKYLMGTLQGYAGAFYDRKSDQLCCIKAGLKERIEAGRTWDNVRVKESFSDEIVTMAKISAFPDVHPGICQHITTWDGEDQIYCAMEYLAGGSLLDFANHRLHGEESLAPSLPLREYMGANRRRFLPNGWEYPRLKVISRVMHQTVDSMAWLHGKGIVHLDLSLENIMLVDDNLRWPTVKIIDFGVALDLAETPKVFRYGRLIWEYAECVGKEKYMAPEVARCHRRAVRRRNGLVIPYDVEAAEIFTLGSILFMMIFGRYPPQSLFRAIERGRVRKWFHDEGWSCWMTQDAFDLLNRIWAPESTRITMAELKRHPFIQLGRNPDRSKKDRSSHSSTEPATAARHQSICRPDADPDTRTTDRSVQRPNQSTQPVSGQADDEAPAQEGLLSRPSVPQADSFVDAGFFLVRVPTETLSDDDWPGEGSQNFDGTSFPDTMDVDCPQLEAERTEPGLDNQSVPMDFEDEGVEEPTAWMHPRATQDDSDFEPEGIFPHRTL